MLNCPVMAQMHSKRTNNLLLGKNAHYHTLMDGMSGCTHTEYGVEVDSLKVVKDSSSLSQPINVNPISSTVSKRVHSSAEKLFNRRSLQPDDDKDLRPCNYDWTLSKLEDGSNTNIKIYGCGDIKNASNHLDSIVKWEKMTKNLDIILSSKTVPMEDVVLPDDLRRMIDQFRLAHRLAERDNQLDQCSSCPVVIKEIIPGKRIPCVTSFFDDNGYLLRTSRFQHPMCNDRLPLESRPELITPEDLIQKQMLLGEYHLMGDTKPVVDDSVAISDVTPTYRIVESIYPKLPDVVDVEDGHTQELECEGIRFKISGVRDNPVITPKSKKYKIEHSDAIVNFGSTQVPVNTWVNHNCPPGKFKTRRGKIWVEKTNGLSMAILYSTTILSLLSTVLSDLPIGFLCGDDKHGTLWSLPEIPSCKPHNEKGEGFRGRVFIKKPTYPVSSYVCYESITIDVTMLGFFGTKSHLSHTDIKRPVDVDTCKAWAAGKVTNIGKLKPVGENIWYTNIPHVVDYSYCCTSDTYSTTNHVLRSVNITVHTGMSSDIMISSDVDLHECNYTKGSCVTSDRTVVWEVDQRRCNLEVIGEGRFERLIDGSVFSKELQLALEVENSSLNACGHLMSETAQGVYLLNLGNLNFTRRPVRDIDAGEKNYLLSAAQLYTDRAIEGLNYISCTNDKLLNFYLSEVIKSNPSRIARSYLRREDVAAKMVGEAWLVWECARVEIHTINYSHNRSGVCYDLVPVEYEWDRGLLPGFMDLATKEVHPISSTHDCASVSGYVHRVGDKLYLYKSDGSFTESPEVKQFPLYTIEDASEHFFFTNTELHSIYGPAGSRYQESLLGEIAGLAGNLVVGNDIYSNPEYTTRVHDKIHSMEEVVKGFVSAPWVLMAKLLLIIVCCTVTYMVIRSKIQSSGLVWPEKKVIPSLRAVFKASKDNDPKVTLIQE